MVKVRMNTADVAAEVKCLRRLIGMRCSNVYDISPKTYLFKLMNSSGITESGESERVLLLMESGVRLHTTEYVRDKSTTPSGFTLKLRKHIRTRRLEDVRQLGYDRVVVLQFGLGTNTHFVILELYAQGNIILTDSEFTVMTLLRSHRDDDKGFAIMSRHRYPIEACRVFEKTSFTKLQTTLTYSTTPASVDLLEVEEGGTNGKLSDSNRKAKDGIQGKKVTLKTVLGESLGYGPALSEHIILDAGLLPSMKIGSGSSNSIDDGTLEVLSQAVGRFEDWLADVVSGERVPEGYIFMQNRVSGKNETVPSQIYDEFSPILLNQFKSREFVEMANFDAALDEFYSKIESQKADQQQKAREGSAMQKLNKIRLDQENRVHILKKEVDHCIRMAELIEYNLDDVDAAILAVRVALANGMDWVDLARMVKEERKSGNPVAGLIDKLHLERNCITLLLSNNLDEMDEDEKTCPADKVEIDLALSAHANACRWFEQKKRQENKQEKTVTAHEKAFKAAERKTRFQLSQEKSVAAISHMRKVHWFEKFNWFISSENYLVISGRDAQQNEMIVKRYMSKGDLYIHADLHGASSTVIKNHKPENSVPPLTLNQAGCFTVCHSQAWEAKIVTSAWWVYPHQVSKTAPTGEYLTVGSFMIRGKKNFLPPHPLVMGFGMLFRLDESSLGLHLNERRVRGEEEGEHAMEERVSLRENTDSGSEGEISGEEVADKSENLSLKSNLSTIDSKLKLENDSGAGCARIDSCSSNLKSMGKYEDTLQEKGTTRNNVDDENGIDMPKFEKSAPSISPELEVLMDQALGLGSAKAAEKSFGLDNFQDTKTVEHDLEDRKATLRDKPYLSKAGRRKLKKGQKDIDITSGQQESKELDENHFSGSQENKGAEDLKPPRGKISRGQRGKLKKIKEKYAEQDDEEREIRMTLLASAGKTHKDEKELSKDKSGPADKKISSLTGQEDITKICYKCKRAGHLARDCQGPVNEIDEAKEVTDKHVGDGNIPTADLENAAREADSMALEEDDIHEIGEEEKGKLNELDYFTGNPVPNDILHYAVPVCAPYNALQTYKYRVKIMPGTAKKGKAAKTAMNLFSHVPDATSREKELMKACTEPELVAAMLGNVKIAAAGLTMLKQKQKKGKKGSKGES